MPSDLIPSPPPRLIASGLAIVPRLVAEAGPEVTEKFFDFFVAEIRNPNTRAAYARATARFLDWCDARHLSLKGVLPTVVGAYVEELGKVLAKPSVKQHLAAIRMLFDYLVRHNVGIAMNPASAVRGPRYVAKRGKTPVLTAEEARHLLDSIDVSTVLGLRDRALIALMCYTFARVGAAVKMRVEDYRPNGKRWWVHLHEKGGKEHAVPAHHKLEEYLDAYLLAASLTDDAKGPLFRRASKARALGGDRLTTAEAHAMLARRARRAGLPAQSGRSAAECARILAGVAPSSPTALRDRALLALLCRHVSMPAALRLDLADYGEVDGSWQLRLQAEDGSTLLHCDRPLRSALDGYLAALGVPGASTRPLFRGKGSTPQLAAAAMTENDVLRMIKRRAAAAGLPATTCCHTFRATGITAYLQSKDSKVEIAQQIAGHESPRTTRLYDRRDDQIKLEEVEKIGI